MDWQPIETAPEDQYLLVHGTYAWINPEMGETAGEEDFSEDAAFFLAEFSGADWIAERGPQTACVVKATHWMPLPPPPGTAKPCGFYNGNNYLGRDFVGYDGFGSPIWPEGAKSIVGARIDGRGRIVGWTDCEEIAAAQS